MCIGCTARQLAGWGPLAPGEDWQPSAAPQQFLNVNTTYAIFRQDARVIDPAGFKDRPKEPLGVAVFALALPSPALLGIAPGSDAARCCASAPRKAIAPVVPGTTFQDSDDAPPPPAAAADAARGGDQPAPMTGRRWCNPVRRSIPARPVRRCR